jgi:hypothetical protein
MLAVCYNRFMAGIKWTKEEDEVLKNLWPTSTKEEITKFFNRSYASLIIRASNLGIKKIYEKHPYIQSDLSVLLKNEPESLYWVGFLLADGSVDKLKRLKLTLSIKDKDHLLKFKDFCKIETYHFDKIKIGVQAQDKSIIGKFCEKYDFKPNKTCNPSSYIPLKEDLFLSFLIGFIDGDGCINRQSGGRRDCVIRIKVHNSWLDYLNILGREFARIVKQEPIKAKINSKGYAILTFYDSVALKFLKRKAIELNLPILKRKWDRIDLDYISKKEKTEINKREMKKFFKKGYSNKDIADKIGLSENWISQQRKKVSPYV